MRLSKLALGLGLAAVAVTAANAAKVTVDLRHEYRTEYGQNFDRICFITAFDNGIGAYVDSSVKSGHILEKPTDPSYKEGQWGDFAANAVEMSLWWGFKFGNFTVTPGIITETSTDTFYKPYLRLQYNTDFGLWFAVRPRYDYLRNSGGSDPDWKRARVDAWLGYNKDNWGVNYNFTWMKALNDNENGTKQVLFDNKDTNYEHNVAFNYRIGQWNPYAEIGDIGVNSATDKRQMRFRVGVQYTF